MDHSTLSVAILSGKGGVGKTNIALNLGYALYKVKQRVHVSEASFKADANGIMALGDGSFVGKRDNASWSLRQQADGWLYEDERLTALLDAETLAAKRAELKKGAGSANLGDVAQTVILCDLLRGALPCKA